MYSSFVEWIFQGEFFQVVELPPKRRCELDVFINILQVRLNTCKDSGCAHSICETFVRCEKKQFIPIIPRWPLASARAHPRVDWALRTERCVYPPYIISGPHTYFRRFHVYIYHLQNVCELWKKSSLFPSYLAIPYHHQHEPRPTCRLGVANRLVRVVTINNCKPA